MGRSGRSIRGHGARHQRRSTHHLCAFHEAEDQVGQAAGAAAMFVLRSGVFVLPMLSSKISHASRLISDPSKRIIVMITPPIANIDIDTFSPPVEQAPEGRFQTFVEVLVAVIQQGQAESKGGVSQGRRDLLIDEWQKMSKALRAYMNTHYNTLLPRQQKVREFVIFAANRDINDFSDWFSTPRYL